MHVYCRMLFSLFFFFAPTIYALYKGPSYMVFGAWEKGHLFSGGGGGGGGGGWRALAKYFWGAGKHCQNVISFKKGLAFVRLRPEEPPLSISVLLSVRLSSSATNV